MLSFQSQRNFPSCFHPNIPSRHWLSIKSTESNFTLLCQSVVTMLRQTFWITSIRQYARKLLRRWVNCRKVQGKVSRAPDSAPPPNLRVQEAIPSSVTGVDFTAAIKSSLSKASITLTDIQTLAIGVEAVLNDRPITYVSIDYADEELLTPFHLLNGRRITSLPYPIANDDSSDPYYGSAYDMRQLEKAQVHVL